MRPKLKSDTFFIPVAEGVYVRNNDKSFTIKGKTLAAWLERLAPALDGRHDLQDLCGALPGEKRQVIEHLILKLAEQGCIKDTSRELPHTLPPALLETYGPAITFIDYHIDSGAARFQRFLETPVLAIGSGERLLALAHALLETGNREISLLDTGESVTDYARMQEILHALRAERDDGLRLHILDAWLWNDEEQLQKLCTSAGIVLYFGRGDQLVSVDQLNTLCRQVSVPFLPAIVWDDAIQIGPLCHPDRPTCWQCLWRRRRAVQGLPSYSTAGHILGKAEQEIRYPGKPAIGVTANILAEAFFTHCTQVDWQTLREAFLLLELQHLQNTKHTLFPHPLCTACGAQRNVADQRQSVLEEVAHLVKQELPSESEQSERLEAWTDEEGGLFARLDYAEYHQLPLTRCQVSVPLASDIPYALPRVQAAELDYPEAYRSAGRQAVAVYAESLADARRICWGTSAQYTSHAVRPERLFGWCENSPDRSFSLAWTWGCKMTACPASQSSFMPVLVPAAAVVPRSSWNRRNEESLFRLEVPATGVGATWYEALADTLSRLSSSICLQAEPDTQVGGSLYSIAEALYQDDQECAAYQKILQILRAHVCLIDCTDSFGVPRVGAYLDGKWLGIFSHWHTLCAIRAALKQAVFSVQIRRTPGPNDPLINEEDSFSAQQQAAQFARISPRTTLMPSLAAETDYVAAATALCAAFERQVWDILVIPLPADRTVRSIWPCVLRVLALRKERGGRR
jgi:putative thiazole-containing bacteriocin maturation protein